MSHVAFVGPEIEENLSLRYLASTLAVHGHTSDIVPFNQDADFAPAVEAILAKQPLLVGISLAFQWRATDFLALAVALRERGYRGHITAGGHFATFESLPLLRDFPELDSIVRQESELTIVELVKALETQGSLQEIPGLAVRDTVGEPRLTGEARLPDLATLPRPDRRGEPASCFGHGIAPLVSSRGCYANCSFCCIAAWHEQSLPGKRYRVRDPDDVAAEMVELKQTRGIDIFVFHDDNFFVPGHKKNKERFTALADALERRKIGQFATVVKARPTDTNPEVFRILVERLNCIRVYIGIETDTDQGLTTLQRWSSTKLNRSAIELVRELDLYTCFNMLIFDPDTTLDALATNIEFIRWAAEYPSNFGRVELYAGTPLLSRMLSENRCRGDYMQWDYALSNPDVERMFDLTMRCFHARNFGENALSNRIMATRFDIEVCRHFHPDVFRPSWLAHGKELSRRLATDGAEGLRRILEHVRARPASEDLAFVDVLTPGFRETERAIFVEAKDLARELFSVIGRGRPLTDIGDRVATPLQTQRLAAGGLR
jgi:anaerobic magnesium-protoporphyrin IX monomethyl ester cyclase